MRIMKASVRWGIGLAVFMLAGVAVVSAADSSGTAGSIDDPVITKSYFEQNIKQRIADEFAFQGMSPEKIRQMVANEVANVRAQLSGSGGGASNPIDSSGTPRPNTPSTQNPSIPASAFTGMGILKLEPGQTLYAGSGTELIVRTGKLTVISLDENGIPDVTLGKDLAPGAAVETNHLLVVPRDGRGLRSDPKIKQDIFIMVRGAYLLLNADGTRVQ